MERRLLLVDVHLAAVVFGRLTGHLVSLQLEVLGRCYTRPPYRSRRAYGLGGHTASSARSAATRANGWSIMMWWWASGISISTMPGGKGEGAPALRCSTIRLLAP